MLCAVMLTPLLTTKTAMPCAAGVVDAVLIPEVPFTIKGPHGLFKYLEGVLEKKGHCVVCIAEGAGQVRRHTHCAIPSLCLGRMAGMIAVRNCFLLASRLSVLIVVLQLS